MELSEIIWLVSIAIELVNLLLLLVLTRLFWNNYRRLRSPFTKGLLLFSSAFFLKSLITIGYLGAVRYVIRDLNITQVSPPLIVPLAFNIFECIALVALLSVTRE